MSFKDVSDQELEQWWLDDPNRSPGVGLYDWCKQRASVSGGKRLNDPNSLAARCQRWLNDHHRNHGHPVRQPNYPGAPKHAHHDRGNAVVSRATYPNGSPHERYLARIKWGEGKHGNKRRTRSQVAALHADLGNLLDSVSVEDLTRAAVGVASGLIAILEHGHQDDPLRRASAARVDCDRLSEILRQLHVLVEGSVSR